MVYNLVVNGVQTKVTIDGGKLTLAPEGKPESIGASKSAFMDNYYISYKGLIILI